MARPESGIIIGYWNVSYNNGEYSQIVKASTKEDVPRILAEHGYENQNYQIYQVGFLA